MNKVSPKSALTYFLGFVLLSLGSCGGCGGGGGGGGFQVSSTSLGNNLAEVSISTAILVVFNGELNPATMDDSTLYLESPAGKVGAALSYDNGAKTASLMPAKSLAIDSEYTLRATKGLKNTGGSALASEFSLKFRTKTGAWGAVNPSESVASDVNNFEPKASRSGDIFIIFRQRTDSDNSGVIDNADFYSLFVRRFDSVLQAWVGPELVESDETNSISSPTIEVDDLGNAAVVFTRTPGAVTSIFGNFFDRATGSWEGDQLLDNSDFDGVASVSRPVCYGPKQFAFVFRQRTNTNAPFGATPGPEDKYSAYAVRYDGDSGWQLPDFLEDSSLGSVSQVNMVGRDDGTLMAQWTESVDGNAMFFDAEDVRTSYFAQWDANAGDWGAPIQIPHLDPGYTNGESGLFPFLSGHGKDFVFICQEQYDSNLSGTVTALDESQGGGIVYDRTAAAFRVSTPFFQEDNVFEFVWQTAFGDGEGNAGFLYSGRNNLTNRIATYLVRYDGPSLAWGAPQLLDSSASVDTLPHAFQIGPDGKGFALFSQQKGDTDLSGTIDIDDNWKILVRSYDSHTGEWGAALDMTSPGLSSVIPFEGIEDLMCGSDSGVFQICWTESFDADNSGTLENPGIDGYGRIFTARFDPVSQSWSAPELHLDYSDPTTRTVGLMMGSGAGNAVIAVYEQNTGTPDNLHEIHYR